MENKTVIAVIGCGRIAKNAHFPAFSKMDNVYIKYACDLIEEKAQAFKDEYAQVENVITDYHVALNDPEVDAVFVLTPNYAHYVVTMDALRAGKHVFCEKPITVNYELSCEMAEEAKKQGKLLNIGVVNRFNTYVMKIRELIDSGTLDDGSKIKPSDVAIIMRSAKGKANLYSDALEKMGIPPHHSHLYCMNGCNQIDIMGKSHMGLEDGEIIRVFDYEMEYVEE